MAVAPTTLDVDNKEQDVIGALVITIGAELVLYAFAVVPGGKYDIDVRKDDA